MDQGFLGVTLLPLRLSARTHLIGLYRSPIAVEKLWESGIAG
jgi:hypothetical protein